MNYKNLLILFYEGNRLNELLIKMCPDKRYVDDLKQELILHLLEKDEIELLRLLQTGEIYFYSYGYLKNQYHSSSSEFFKKYRNFEAFYDDIEWIDFDIKDQNRIIKIENILETKVDFFSAFLFRKYYCDWFDENKGKSVRGRSYRKIEKEYSLNSDFKIDHTYIFHSVRQTLEVVKKELGIL